MAEVFDKIMCLTLMIKLNKLVQIIKKEKNQKIKNLDSKNKVALALILSMILIILLWNEI